MGMIRYRVSIPGEAIGTFEVDEERARSRSPAGKFDTFDTQAHPHVVDIVAASCMVIFPGINRPPLTDEGVAWMRDAIRHPWSWAENGFLAFADEGDALLFKMFWC